MNSEDKHSRRKDARPPGIARSTPFDNWAIGHPHYNTIENWLLKRLSLYSDPCIFLIVGPTGAGKTTMNQQIRRKLALQMEPHRLQCPWIVPTVCAESTYVPGRGHDWKGLFTDLLESANEILIEHKIDIDLEVRGGSLHGLEKAVSCMLLHRSPAAILIDEGSALVEAQTDDSLLRSLRYLKNIGNKSRTHIVIFGDYRLAKMVAWDGQLNRRCHLAHLPAYMGSEGFDRFRPIIERFEQKLRESGVNCDFYKTHADSIFELSCGCVGLMRKWLLRSYAESIENGMPLDGKLLEFCKPEAKAIERWRREIHDGQHVLQSYIGKLCENPGGNLNA